jgi:hypothetical protein
MWALFEKIDNKVFIRPSGAAGRRGPGGNTAADKQYILICHDFTPSY